MSYDQTKIVGEAEVQEDGKFKAEIWDQGLNDLLRHNMVSLVPGGTVDCKTGETKITEVSLTAFPADDT